MLHSRQRASCRSRHICVICFHSTHFGSCRFAGSSSFAFRPQAQAPGSPHRQANRPFTRPAHPKPAETPFTWSQPTSSFPNGANAPSSRPATSKPAENPFTSSLWQAPDAWNSQAPTPATSAEASGFSSKGPNHAQGRSGQSESSFQAHTAPQTVPGATPVDQPEIHLLEGFAAFFGSKSRTAASSPTDSPSFTAEGSSPPAPASAPTAGAQVPPLHTTAQGSPADADLAAAFASAFSWNRPPADTPSAMPAALSTATLSNPADVNSTFSWNKPPADMPSGPSAAMATPAAADLAAAFVSSLNWNKTPAGTPGAAPPASTTVPQDTPADADIAAAFASASSWNKTPAETPSAACTADGQGNSSCTPSDGQAADSTAPLQSTFGMPQSARSRIRPPGTFSRTASSPKAGDSSPAGQAAEVDQEKVKAPMFGAFQAAANPANTTGKMRQSFDLPVDGLIGSSSYAAAAVLPNGDMQSSAEAAEDAAGDSTAQVRDDLPSLGRPTRSVTLPPKPEQEAASPLFRSGASPFSFGRPSVGRGVGSANAAQGNLPSSVDAAAAVAKSARTATTSKGLGIPPVVDSVEAFTLGQSGSANGTAGAESPAAQSPTVAGSSDSLPPPSTAEPPTHGVQGNRPGPADADADSAKPESDDPSTGFPSSPAPTATSSASNLSTGTAAAVGPADLDGQSSAMEKGKGIHGKPVFNMTASAGQHSVKSQQSAGGQTSNSGAAICEVATLDGVRSSVVDSVTGTLAGSGQAADANEDSAALSEENAAAAQVPHRAKAASIQSTACVEPVTIADDSTAAGAPMPASSRLKSSSVTTAGQGHMSFTFAPGAAQSEAAASGSGPVSASTGAAHSGAAT